MTGLGRAFQELLAVLERAGMPFLIGGSVASSTHGIPRLTNDIDIVIDLPVERVPGLCGAFAPDWYADRDMAASSVRTGRSFNVIYMQTASKFGFFPIGSDAFGRSELARRQYTTTTIAGLESIKFPVASPEDTLLSKLVWYQKGHGISGQQWHDLLSIAHVQVGRLDDAYLDNWASELGVAELLRKLRLQLTQSPGQTD